MSKVIKVGMADLNFAKAPDSIRTTGLGSCVGIIIYDEISKFSGMAHIMLPDSSIAREKTLQRAKYADTAIEDLLKKFSEMGIPSFRLKAKIAGGAQMFKFSSGNDLMRIGPRNAEAVKQKLKENKIKLVSEDIGGSSGRTIEFFPETSILQIRTVNKGVKEI